MVCSHLLAPYQLFLLACTRRSGHLDASGRGCSSAGAGIACCRPVGERRTPARLPVSSCLWMPGPRWECAKAFEERGGSGDIGRHRRQWRSGALGGGSRRTRAAVAAGCSALHGHCWCSTCLPAVWGRFVAEVVPGCPISSGIPSSRTLLRCGGAVWLAAVVTIVANCGSGGAGLRPAECPWVFALGSGLAAYARAGSPVESVAYRVRSISSGRSHC